MLDALVFRAYDEKTMGASRERERLVVGRHSQCGAHPVPPKERSGQVDRVEGPEFSRHRLSRPIKDDGIDLDDVQRINQRKERRAPRRHFGIREAGAESKAIQRAETLGHDQRAGNAVVDLPPFRQSVRLPKYDSQQDRRVGVRSHRCP